MRGFDQVPDAGGNDSAKLEELFEMFDQKTATKSFVAVRFMPYSMLPVRRHWIQITTQKGKATGIPKMCCSFDADNPAKPLKGKKCPYCTLSHGKPEDGHPAKYEEYMLANVLVRDLQDSGRFGKMTKTEKKTGIKEIDSKSPTPIRVIRMPMGVARRIKEMAEMNKGKNVHDPKYGIDVMFKYNAKAAPADMYKLERGDRTPLTEKEMAYLRWDLDNADEVYDLMGRLSPEAAMAEFKKLDIRGTETDEDEDEDDDDDVPVGKKGKKSKGKKARFDEDDDDDEDDEDEDEDDDEPSNKKKGKSKVKPKAKKKARFDDEDEDEDEDDDDDDDDEDDDDEPVNKKKGKSKVKPKAKAKGKKARFDDEDEDEDDDDEDEDDDDDDEPVNKKKGKSKVVKKKKAAEPVAKKKRKITKSR